MVIVTRKSFKIFNVKDGFGIVSWHKLGRKSAIITGRSSRVVERRAKELGIAYLFQDVKNKKETLELILNKKILHLKMLLLSEMTSMIYRFCAPLDFFFAPVDALPWYEKKWMFYSFGWR